MNENEGKNKSGWMFPISPKGVKSPTKPKKVIVTQKKKFDLIGNLFAETLKINSLRQNLSLITLHTVCIFYNISHEQIFEKLVDAMSVPEEEEGDKKFAIIVMERWILACFHLNDVFIKNLYIRIKDFVDSIVGEEFDEEVDSIKKKLELCIENTDKFMKFEDETPKSMFTKEIPYVLNLCTLILHQNPVYTAYELTRGENMRYGKVRLINFFKQDQEANIDFSWLMKSSNSMIEWLKVCLVICGATGRVEEFVSKLTEIYKHLHLLQNFESMFQIRTALMNTAGYTLINPDTISKLEDTMKTVDRDKNYSRYRNNLVVIQKKSNNPFIPLYAVIAMDIDKLKNLKNTIKTTVNGVEEEEINREKILLLSNLNITLLQSRKKDYSMTLPLGTFCGITEGILNCDTSAWSIDQLSVDVKKASKADTNENHSELCFKAMEMFTRNEKRKDSNVKSGGYTKVINNMAKYSPTTQEQRKSVLEKRRTRFSSRALTEEEPPPVDQQPNTPISSRRKNLGVFTRTKSYYTGASRSSALIKSRSSSMSNGLGSESSSIPGECNMNFLDVSPDTSSKTSSGEHDKVNEYLMEKLGVSTPSRRSKEPVIKKLSLSDYLDSTPLNMLGSPKTSQ